VKPIPSPDPPAGTRDAAAPWRPGRAASRRGWLLCLLLAGCAGSPQPRLYTLSEAALPAPEAPATAAGAVAIGPVTLPETIDRPQLVTREGANRLLAHDLERWAEPLKMAIPRVLAQRLAREHGAVGISVHAQTAAAAPLRVPIDVLRLDALPGEAVLIEAAWQVRAKDGGELADGRAAIREPVAGRDFDALVAAHRRALDQLAARIAASLPAARGSAPPPPQ
jgi:hypothetical protein